MRRFEFSECRRRIGVSLFGAIVVSAVVLADTEGKSLELSYVIPSISNMQLGSKLTDVRLSASTAISVSGFGKKIFVNDSHLRIQNVVGGQIATKYGNDLFWGNYLMDNLRVIPFEQREWLGWLSRWAARSAFSHYVKPLCLRVAAVSDKKTDSDDIFLNLGAWNLPNTAGGFIDSDCASGRYIRKVDDRALISAQFAQSPTQNEPLGESNTYRTDGKDGNPNRGVGRSTARPILGAFLCLVGLPFLIFGVKIFDAPFNPRAFVIFGWIFIFGGGLALAQGIILALTGVWVAQLASFDRLSKNVGVQAVIIAELELGDIEWQIFFADLVERPDHAALDERPEGQLDG